MSTTPGPRVNHPYFMYDAIQGQPDAFSRVSDRTESDAGACVERLASCARLFLVGIGTSHHAAQIGEHLVRAYGGGLPVRAVHSFDFALYGPTLGRDDTVLGISHRGTKRYTAASLARAREAGCFTTLVTGEGGPAGAPNVDVTLHTVPQERSSAHTISYAGAVATLATLADQVGGRRTGRRPLGSTFLRTDVPEALRAALGTEPYVEAEARAQAGRRRIWFAGGGPAAVTAQEAALKIKETSYLQAEGMSVEAMLHGPFQCTEPEDLFVLIAPEGPAQARVADLAAEVGAIGAGLFVVGDGTAETPPGAGTCVVPRVPEPLAALTCIVPLQLFAYHLALVRGANPDGFRLHDPRFAQAYARVTL
ncbi:MAG TPA: SIS domain-containing protein [bacterium]|nr:SIS domain-containing protein [bacterium]